MDVHRISLSEMQRLVAQEFWDDVRINDEQVINTDLRLHVILRKCSFIQEKKHVPSFLAMIWEESKKTYKHFYIFNRLLKLCYQDGVLSLMNDIVVLCNLIKDITFTLKKVINENYHELWMSSSCDQNIDRFVFGFTIE